MIFSTLSPMTAAAVVPLDPAGFQQWTSSLARLLETARKQLGKDRSAAEAVIVTASALLRVEVERQSGASDASTPGLAGWQLQRVRTYIEENLDRTIHVKTLSEIARRSPAHFSRAFKRSFGEPPHAYIVRCRLERATHLMLATDDSLSEIAVICGFTDQAHLSNLFRQRVGVSPAGWRRTRREPRCGSVSSGSRVAGRTPVAGDQV